MEIVPTHRGVRSLTAPTMLNVLMSTHMGEELWRIMETMFAGDDDMHRVMVNLYDIHESGFINLPSIGITRWDQELGRFVVPTEEIEDPAIPADESTMTPVVNRHLFHKSMPGFSTLVHLSNHDIPGRYLVARTLWGGLPVYIHNIYPPVESHLRGEFFALLPRDFEPDSLHLVGGDFNLPLHPSLDATTLHSSHGSGKSDCVEWLTALGVIDVWRQLNPSTRLFSGPGRVNRLDYLFVHGELVSHLHPEAKYDPNGYGGDHLTHTVTPSQSLSTTTKPLSSTTHLQHLRLRLAATKRSLECDGDNATKVADVAAAQLAYDSAKSEQGQYSRDRQFDFHANSNERGTSHFFRKPLGTKVPINFATVDGMSITDEPTIQNTFTAHWRSIMSAPQVGNLPDHDRRRAVLEALTKRFELVDRDSLDKPITVKELCDAMKTMNPSKSPDPDGWWLGAGFVPGRRLHDHVTMVQALQHYCTLEDQDSYATFLDFSKAYDMVDQSFLFEVLAEMNLGANFISWVRMLYNSPVASIMFNGTLGPAIRPTRGVKRGYPLSCLLFVLYLEPLGDMLRAQPQHGISLPHGESMTSIFFADDSTLLSKDLPAAVEQLGIVEEFCAVSGARLNQDKCQTMVLNGHLDPADTDGGDLLNIVPTGKPIKYLGLMFGHQLPSDYQLNLINE
ncbi:hypothetical protein DYB28_011204, partial [Aphanomyces astaci]